MARRRNLHNWIRIAVGIGVVLTICLATWVDADGDPTTVNLPPVVATECPDIAVGTRSGHPDSGHPDTDADTNIDNDADPNTGLGRSSKPGAVRQCSHRLRRWHRAVVSGTPI